MNKKERIINTINNKKRDVYPFSFWTHLPSVDEDPIALANETYHFYKKYDVDFIKMMNNGLYSTVDYGCNISSENVLKGGVSKITETPIHCIADFKKIGAKHLDEMPTFKRELLSFDTLIDLLGDDDVPVLFTVFSPMTTLNKICGGKLLDYIKQDVEHQIDKALQHITDSTVELVEEINKRNRGGIYFATQMSDHKVCNEETYKRYGVPYDLQILKRTTGYCDIIHCHGDDIMFDILKDYPIDLFNWHAYQSKPTLNDAKKAGKTLLGGLLREDITRNNPDAIKQQINQCIDAYGKVNHIFSPGCVIRYPLNEATLLQIRDWIRAIELD